MYGNSGGQYVVCGLFQAVVSASDSHNDTRLLENKYFE